MSYTEIQELIGETFAKVFVNDCDSRLSFVREDETGFVFYHEQSCCENVSVEDVCGDLEDLCNSPILEATETSNSETGEFGLVQWTFYTFRTNKGTVTVRWYGASNGYYSTGVSMTTL